MSRIGVVPIDIPNGVDVDIKNKLVTVKGPKGELKYTLNNGISAKVDSNKVVVSRDSDEYKKFHGLARSLINNMTIGVSEGYKKELEIVGTGFRVQPKGTGLELALGFSHMVNIEPPKGIKFTAKDLKITVEGIDKQQVGEAAANIRKVKPPEPYKGKGIRYVGEIIKKKEGKTGAK
jgi:large subunit ribosomal protein L6